MFLVNNFGQTIKAMGQSMGGGGQRMRGRVRGELDERGSKSPVRRRVDGGFGEGMIKGVKLLRRITAIHNFKISPQNSFGE